MPAAPTPEKRAAMEQKLGELIQAIENHELWTPPTPNQTLYHVWDFLNRSKYMLSEFDNIEAGRPLTHPNQFRPAPGTGAAAAKRVYDDVVGRNMMAQMMVTDTTGKTAMLTGGSGAVDFGSDAKEKVRALNSV
ncbi:hypothetical protein O988_04198 [Pseudogymnoascus sp. VKM F-3808]|nr:hypothetical protein V490_06492 [Pseudogymnoascus sp. VKM F-3557]KFX98791.1 hypothetical protein O988_04198 [Pseudogymnoascus sp. VKM F-3808]